MNHKEIERQLSAYVDRELDEPSARTIREHLDRCAACQTRVHEMSSIRERIREAATAELPDNFAYAVRRALRQSEQESVLWLGTERLARNVVVGLCVLVLALVAFGNYINPQPLVGEDRYFSGEVSDSAAHAILGSQQELSKEDVMIAALSK